MAGEAGFHTSDLPPRLSTKIRVNPVTGCWEWTGAAKTGRYGQVRMGDKNRRAHRVVFELLIGPVPGDLQLDHLCRSSFCVNPSHLEIVTGRQNVRRGNAMVILDHPRCLAGHLITFGSTTCLSCTRPAETAPHAPEPEDRQLAEHVLAVMETSVREHSVVVCERLHEQWPTLYGDWTPLRLSRSLRRLRVRTRQICVRHTDGSMTNRRGVYRADLLLALVGVDAR